MPDYPALVDGEEGAFGVTFPDLPGIVAMGKTMDEAILNAAEALKDYAFEALADCEEIIPPTPVEKTEISGSQHLVSVPLVFGKSRKARAS